MFMIDVDTALEIFELAKKHGKKVGDNCQEEFDEVRNKNPDKFVYVGNTEKDIDLLTGDLRENGLKIFNMNEIERRNKNENQSE
jgi:SpoVK/Ycf46/Vps4 family AAA+-type ATPase